MLFRSVLRMLIIFSDGLSNRVGDFTKVEQTIRIAKENGVSIYPVMLLSNTSRTDVPDASRGGLPNGRGGNATGAPGMPDPPPPPPRSDAPRLESIKAYLNLATATGGQSSQEMMSEGLLPRILKIIAERMQFDYVVGYYPAATTDKTADKKTPHAVQVVLRSKERGTILGGTRIVVH